MSRLLTNYYFIFFYFKVSPWVLLLIIFMVLIIILSCVYLALKKFCSKLFQKNDRVGFGVVDFKTMPLFNGNFKEKIQPDIEQLTQNMQESEESVDDIKKQTDCTNLGHLQYTLDYDFQNQELTVGVIQASDLPVMDVCGTSDPYVKIYMKPDKKKKFETKVHRKTLNPVFNETFVFKVFSSLIISEQSIFMSLYFFSIRIWLMEILVQRLWYSLFMILIDSQDTTRLVK